MTTIDTPADLVAALAETPRLLLEASLRPAQGQLFQPTGFPDIGAAVYTTPDGTQMLEVESPQSMANRLEQVCWSEPDARVVPALDGMPYVTAHVTLSGDRTRVTSSLTEAHRLNSPYLLDERLRDEAGKETKIGRLESMLDERTAGDWGDRRAFATALLALDPNSLLHGVFVANVKHKGEPKLTRALSSFIEASDVVAAATGGVKNDTIDPSGKEGSGAKDGYGNVPFARTEYTAREITAFFSLDLARLRAYGLPEEGYAFVVALGAWKIATLLESDLRLRTRCDFEVEAITAKRPDDFVLPSTTQLTKIVQAAIAACDSAGHFAQPPVTELTWTTKKKPATTSAS